MRTLDRPRGFVLLLLLGVAAPARAKDAPPPTVVFLDREAAATAIVDESLEPYLSLLQPAEMEAKTGRPLEATELSAQREECKERYRAGVREFSDAEQAGITTLVGRVHAAWGKAYPVLANLEWSFLGVSDTIEGGLPHTRGRSIVLPRSATAGLAGAAAGAGGSGAALDALQVLAHEQCHVLQRTSPALFDSLYASWGFVKAPGLQPPAEILPRHVFNPDGVRTEWVYVQGTGSKATSFLPLVALRNLDPPHRMPHEFEMIYVAMRKAGSEFLPARDKEGELQVRPLPSATEYRARFGGIDENFHPNEIFAVLFAAMAIHDYFDGPGLPQPSEAAGPDFKTLRAWCTKHLAR